MKNILVLLFLALSGVAARAMIIEGVTPSGKFKSVYVTEDGRIPVETSTGAATHVIVDSGTVRAYQGGVWNVGTAVGVSVTVTPSTSAVVVTGQFATSGTAGVVYPADVGRKQGTVCNNDGGVNMFVGDSGVGVGTGVLIGPGSCLGPDNPTAFVGALYGISTAAAVGSYIYFK